MGLNPKKPTLLLHTLTLQALRCSNSLQDVAEGLPTYGCNDLLAELSAHLKEYFSRRMSVQTKTPVSLSCIKATNLLRQMGLNPIRAL